MKSHWLSCSLPVPFCNAIRQLPWIDASGENASSGISDLNVSTAALRAEPCQFKPIQKSLLFFPKCARHCSLRAWFALRCGSREAELLSQSSVRVGKHDIGVDVFKLSEFFLVRGLKRMDGKLVSKSLSKGLGTQTSS